MEEVHRVFVGGLFDAVTKDELKNRFQTFGDVKDVTIVHKKDGAGNILKTFGYVNLMTTPQKLSRCFAVYGGTKWKGHELKVQLAKEDFITRLQKERNEPDVVKKKKKKGNIGPTKTYTDILETTATMRRIVPGTPVEGEKNWVIGKYGRPLPIVHITNAGRKKTVKVDPSKFCHCLKRIPDVDDDQVQVDKLTWSYDRSEMTIMEKRKIENKDNLSGNNETVEGKQLADTEKSYGTMEIQPQKKKKKKDKEKDIGSEVLNDSESSVNYQVFETNGCDGEIEVHSVNGGFDTQSGKRKKKNGDTENKEKNVEKAKKKKHENNSDEKSTEKTENTVNECIGDDLINTENIDKLLNDSSNSDTVDSTISDKRNEKNEEETTLNSIDIDSTSKVKGNVVGRGKKRKHNAIDTNLNEKKTQRVDHDLSFDKSSGDRSVNILNSGRKGKVEQCLESSSSNALEVSIPEMLFEDTQIEPSIDNTDTENKKLSTSIVQQLLSASKKPPLSGGTSSDHFINSTSSSDKISLSTNIVKQLSALEKPSSSKNQQISYSINNDKGSEDEDLSEGEHENLFDFEFDTIAGENKKSFLDKLMNSFEVRDNYEVNESSEEESDDDFASSNNSSLTENSVEPWENEISNATEDCSYHEGGKTVVDVKMLEKKCEGLSTDIDAERLKNAAKKDKLGLMVQPKNTPVEIEKNIKKSKIMNSNKEEKHALSEEKRKKSLEARNSQILQNKGLVSKALKDVDKSKVALNHIVFSDDDSDDDSSQVKEISAVVTDVSTGMESKDHLDEKKLESKGTKELFDDSEEEEETEEEEIIIKPQFQGKEGEKLFKLQQKFGGDERFKLDERFAEEENEIDSVENEEDRLSDTEDTQKEKEMNISILEQVLGKSISVEKKEREYVLQRYDPDNVEHEKFEVKEKLAETKDEDLEIPKVKKAQPVVELPEVSKETFYSVNESIKDLFGKGESVSFSFFGSETCDTQEQETVETEGISYLTSKENPPEEPAEQNMEVESMEKIKVPSWKKSLDDMTRHEEKEEVNIDSEKDDMYDKTHTFLYIPHGDERLEIGKRFIRTEEIEEITNQWKAMRRTLTEDYKKKHKDAVRRVRKMREKRFHKP